MKDANESRERESHAAAPDVTLRPRVDIYETEDAFVINAEMPGVGREDVDVRLEQGELILLGRVKQEWPSGYDHERIEYRLNNYERSFHLPETVDPEKIEATMKHGVLQVRLPKQEAAKPKAIKIKVA